MQETATLGRNESRRLDNERFTPGALARSSTQLTLGLRRERVPRGGEFQLEEPIGGPAQLAGLKELCGRGWPARPVLTALTIPPPPPLPAGREPAELRAILSKTYRNVVAQTWKVTARFGTTRGAAKYDGMLDAAAELLQEAGVPPARWVLFSASQWLLLGEASERQMGAVAAKWVYSRKRLEEQLGRASEVELFGAYPTNRSLVDLWSQWHAFTLAVVWAAPKTRDEVLTVVDQYFPGERYEKMMAKAEQEQARLQRWIDSTVTEGGVVWAL
jgi:hypothetical protein